MHHYLSPETKQQLREAVKQGKTRQQTMIEFGISPATAYRWTQDLPKQGKAAKRLRPEEKQRLRDLVLNGLSKCQAAKICDISYPYATWLTKDLPNAKQGNRSLSQKNLEILQKLIKEGYFIMTEAYTMYYRTLTQYFPIRIIHFEGKTIIFLEDRREEALKGFLKAFGNKVVTYNKMKELTGLFGLCLDAQMRQELFGKNGEYRDRLLKTPRLTKRAQRWLKIKNSDFIGYFLPSELLAGQ